MNSASMTHSDQTTPNAAGYLNCVGMKLNETIIQEIQEKPELIQQLTDLAGTMTLGFLSYQIQKMREELEAAEKRYIDANNRHRDEIRTLTDRIDSAGDQFKLLKKSVTALETK